MHFDMSFSRFTAHFSARFWHFRRFSTFLAFSSVFYGEFLTYFFAFFGVIAFLGLIAYSDAYGSGLAPGLNPVPARDPEPGKKSSPGPGRRR